MLYDLKNPWDKERFKEKVGKLLETDHCVELKRRNRQRSLSQNAYLHLLLGYFAQEFGYSLEEVKLDVFKRLCNRDLFEVSVVNKRGKEIRCIRSSAALDTAEMTLAIERFRNYSAAVCGLYLPEPNEHEALLYAEQCVERWKEFV